MEVGRAEKRLTENFMRGQHSDMDGINIGEGSKIAQKIVTWKKWFTMQTTSGPRTVKHKTDSTISNRSIT